MKKINILEMKIGMDCGSFWGSVIGAITTLIAFWFTYRISRKQYEATRKEFFEQNRLSVLPFISFSCESVLTHSVQHSGNLVDFTSDKMTLHTHVDITAKYGIPYTGMYIFTFKNVGNGAAINCGFKCANKDSITPLGHMLEKEQHDIYALFPNSNENYNFEITFSDVQSRKYMQSFRLQRSYETHVKESTNYSGISAPKWINENQSFIQ